MADYYSGSARGTQCLHLSFDIVPDSNLKIDLNNAEYLDDKVMEIVNDSLVGDFDLDDYEITDGGFFNYDKLTDDSPTEIKYEIIYSGLKFTGTVECESAHINTSSAYWEDSDDGSTEFEVTGGYIEDVNKSNLIKKLTALDIIGKYIDTKSIYVSISDPDYDDYDWD